MAELYVSDSEIEAGYAVYNRLLLFFYDAIVIHFSNRFIWRCTKKKQLEHYIQYTSSRHLDVGVGSGYYLKHNHWPEDSRLALMDANPLCLKWAARAVQRLSPTLYHDDVFKIKSTLDEQFNSISANYLLHCLPGSMYAKSIVLKHLVRMLKPGGVLFGATILADEHFHTPLSRFLMRSYNQKHVFSNRYDTQLALLDILNQHLINVDVQIIGCVALFKGEKSALS